jgi:Zn-dependent protease
MNLQTALFLLPGLVAGLTVHEASHALAAKLLGDGGPEKAGRLSLNPFRHLSFLGTAALFLLGFGWGRPVIINLYNFKRPKLYYLLSSLAGPGANIILSGTSLGMLYLGVGGVTAFVCISVFYINAILATINLLPIPPLDGSKIWPCVIPGMRPASSGTWNRRWLVVLLILFISGVIDGVIGAVLGFLTGLIPQGL